jgi:protein phosphatase
MGGYEGGEIASKFAVQAAKENIENNFNSIEKNKKEIVELIKNSMDNANKEVYLKSRKTKKLEQMGTTLEICLIYEDNIYIGHIGDSRIYIIRKNKLKKITTDHSYVEKLIKDGTISRKEALYHPKKNILMKALGTQGDLEADFLTEKIQEDDIILICSDGLTNMISENEILNIIKEDYQKAVDRLIRKANDLGGYDNISLIIIVNK